MVRMKRWRLGGVLTKIVTYYLILASLILLSVFTVFNMLFESKMREEVEQYNQRLLEKTAQNLQSEVFAPVRRAYLDLVWQAPMNEKIAYFASQPVRGNHDRFMALYNSLVSLVIRSEGVITSIHIYYPRTGTLLSTAYGYRRLDQNGEGNAAQYDWISSGKTGWFQTRPVPVDFYESGFQREKIHQLSFVSRYMPAQSPESPCILSINVSEDTVRKRILEIMPADYTAGMLLVQDGTVIVSHSLDSLYTRIELSQLRDIPTEKELITLTAMEDPEWIVMGCLSLSHFYASSHVLTRNLLLVGTLIFLVALCLSLLFSRRLYQPVRQLAVKMEGLDPSADKKGDEYAWIDTAIDHVLGRMDHLQHSLKRNASAIRYEFISELLSGKLHTAQEISERLEVLGVSFSYPLFSCAILSLDCPRFRALPFAEKQYLQYRLADRLLCGDKSGNVVCLTRPYAEERIVLLLNCQMGDAAYASIVQRTRGLLSDTGVLFHIACGEWVDDLLFLPGQYKEIHHIQEYHFLFPDRELLWLRELSKRESSEASFDTAQLEGLEAALASMDYERSVAVLDSIIGSLRSGSYPLREVHVIVLKTLSVFANYKRNMKTKEVLAIKQELCEQFNDVDDILQFRSWIMEYLRRLDVTVQEKNTQSHNQELAEGIRSYIDGHLEEDISLDMLSAHFYISQKHLCKIFKEETGETFSRYITRRRMEEAGKLLVNMEMSVEQVGAALGYHSPSYFIKKFREYYGVTPKYYRTGLALSPVSSEVQG